MGGLGSGRWKNHIRKETVDECRIILSMKELQEHKVFKHSQFAGMVRKNSFSVSFSTIRKSSDSIQLVISSGFKIEEQNIEIVAIEHPWGYKLLRFLCPCGKRTEKLYLPTYDNRFLCRECHGLTYHSSQTAHKHDTLFNHLGIPLNQAKFLLKTSYGEMMLQTLSLTKKIEMK